MARRAGYGEVGVSREPDIQQIPEVRFAEGEARAAEDFANSMYRLSSRMQDRLDERAAREAAIQGAIAGQKPNFRPREDDTIAARAFNRAGKQSFLNQIETQARSRVLELYDRHKTNPDDLQAAYSGYRDGMLREIQQVAPELSGDFESVYQRLTLPNIRQAGSNYRALQAAEFKVEAATTIDEVMRSSERLARVQDDSVVAAEQLTGEREHLIQLLGSQGPQGEFTFEGRTFEADPERTGAFSLADMQSTIETFDKRMYKARVIGRFERADSKMQFIEQFRQDQIDDSQSPFTVQEVEALAGDMRARYRAELQDREFAERIQDEALREQREQRERDLTVALFDPDQSVTLQGLVEELDNGNIDRAGFTRLRRQLEGLQQPSDTDPDVHLALLDQAAQAAPDFPDRLSNAVEAGAVAGDDAASLFRYYDSARRRGGVLANDDVKRQRSRIDDIIGGRRGPLAVLDTEESARVANAIGEYNRRVLDGEVPKEVADDVIDRYALAPPSPTAFPRPRYLIGSRSDPEIEETLDATMQAYRDGKLTRQQLTRELETLEQIADAIAERKRRDAR